MHPALACAQSIGEMCAFATRSSTYGAIVLSLVMLVLLPFAGYLVSHVPVRGRLPLGCEAGRRWGAGQGACRSSGRRQGG